MASLGIRCIGGSLSCSLSRDVGSGRDRVKPCLVAISDHSSARFGEKAVSISGDCRKIEPLLMASRSTMEGDEDNETGEVATQRMDDWMDVSVPEIVKSLNKAPLFVQVYEKNQGTGRKCLDLKTEKAVRADDWDVVKAEWETGKTSLPEGVIFVEELTDDDDEELENEAERINQIWGIVVQGKSANRHGVPACYLLKTTRVSSGLGFSAVHFHLTKVNNFREKAKTQLNRHWLAR